MALREIHDVRGMLWKVFAVRPSTARRVIGGTRAELAQGWLCFQCGDDRRRLPGIPGGWEAMTDEALLALLPLATDAPRRDTR